MAVELKRPLTTNNNSVSMQPEPITREQLKVLAAERSRAQSKYDAALKQWKRQKRINLAAPAPKEES